LSFTFLSNTSELKSEVNFSDHRLSFCLSVNFYNFDLFPRATVPIFFWHKSICERGSICWNEGENSSPMGDNWKIIDMLKIFKQLSKTSRPVSIKLDTYPLWWRGLCLVISTEFDIYYMIALFRRKEKKSRVMFLLPVQLW
jgi:hypothetical protein